MRKLAIKAVFFDVDFTLIYPGPTFGREGYRQFCERHGLHVDPSHYGRAVEHASTILDEAQDRVYTPELFISYARNVIEQMGATGSELDACAREIYEEWAACYNFLLYDDVEPTLKQLCSDGLRIGLISNTHRCLSSFQSHFELTSFITAAVSSSQHGYMKPHRSIFESALRLVGVTAAEAIMVGDSVKQDIIGARQVGMRAVLLARAGGQRETPEGVPVIQSLRELSAQL